jgi:hypothetical protein
MFGRTGDEEHDLEKAPSCQWSLPSSRTSSYVQAQECSQSLVDNYYNRFQELLDEINDFCETVSKQDAIQHFIFTLGSDFESIQNSYRMNNLPPDWKTDNLPTLLILCRGYYNSLHPNGPPQSKKDITLGDHTFASKQD